MRVPFTKMHGLGNDFAVVDETRESYGLTADQIARMGNRHTGIGFDQLLVVQSAPDAANDFHYRIFNIDGTEVEHCGNGARCFARFVQEKGLTDKSTIRVSTVNRVLELHTDEAGLVTVNMDKPDFEPSSLPFSAAQRAPSYTRQLETTDGSQVVEFSALSMGNPHAVIFVEDLRNTAVKVIGEALGHHQDFPQGVNVGFAEIQQRNHISLRVYERGTGETLACGSGACAATVAGIQSGRLDREVLVSLPGGDLQVQWGGEGSPVMMKGPATTVYEGMIDL